MKETEFQSAMIKDARTQGAMAWKLNNRFIIGVPDLLIKFPWSPSLLIEVKRGKTLLSLPDTTPHQERWLKDYQKVGGVSGWAMIVPNRSHRDQYQLVFSAIIDYDCDKRLHLIKYRGGEWPMKDMVQMLMEQTCG